MIHFFFQKINDVKEYYELKIFFVFGKKSGNLIKENHTG